MDTCDFILAKDIQPGDTIIISSSPIKYIEVSEVEEGERYNWHDAWKNLDSHHSVVFLKGKVIEPHRIRTKCYVAANKYVLRFPKNGT